MSTWTSHKSGAGLTPGQLEEILILQLIPAAGWHAVHQRKDTTRYTNPLVAWALVERGGDRWVEGLDLRPDGGIWFVNATETFVKYIYQDDAYRLQGQNCQSD